MKQQIQKESIEVEPICYQDKMWYQDNFHKISLLIKKAESEAENKPPNVTTLDKKQASLIFSILKRVSPRYEAPIEAMVRYLVGKYDRVEIPLDLFSLRIRTGMLSKYLKNKNRNNINEAKEECFLWDYSDYGEVNHTPDLFVGGVNEVFEPLRYVVGGFTACVRHIKDDDGTLRVFLKMEDEYDWCKNKSTEDEEEEAEDSGGPCPSIELDLESLGVLNNKVFQRAFDGIMGMLSNKIEKYTGFEYDGFSYNKQLKRLSIKDSFWRSLEMIGIAKSYTHFFEGEILSIAPDEYPEAVNDFDRLLLLSCQSAHGIVDNWEQIKITMDPVKFSQEKILSPKFGENDILHYDNLCFLIEKGIGKECIDVLIKKYKLPIDENITIDKILNSAIISKDLDVIFYIKNKIQNDDKEEKIMASILRNNDFGLFEHFFNMGYPIPSNPFAYLFANFYREEGKQVSIPLIKTLINNGYCPISYVISVAMEQEEDQLAIDALGMGLVPNMELIKEAILRKNINIFQLMLQNFNNESKNMKILALSLQYGDELAADYLCDTIKSVSQFEINNLIKDIGRSISPEIFTKYFLILINKTQEKKIIYPNIIHSLVDKGLLNDQIMDLIDENCDFNFDFFNLIENQNRISPVKLEKFLDKKYEHFIKNELVKLFAFYKSRNNFFNDGRYDINIFHTIIRKIINTYNENQNFMESGDGIIYTLIYNELAQYRPFFELQKALHLTKNVLTLFPRIDFYAAADGEKNYEEIIDSLEQKSKSNGDKINYLFNLDNIIPSENGFDFPTELLTYVPIEYISEWIKKGYLHISQLNKSDKILNRPEVIDFFINNFDKIDDNSFLIYLLNIKYHSLSSENYNKIREKIYSLNDFHISINDIVELAILGMPENDIIYLLENFVNYYKSSQEINVSKLLMLLRNSNFTLVSEILSKILLNFNFSSYVEKSEIHQLIEFFSSFTEDISPLINQFRSTQNLKKLILMADEDTLSSVLKLMDLTSFITQDKVKELIKNCNAFEVPSIIRRLSKHDIKIMEILSTKDLIEIATSPNISIDNEVMELINSIIMERNDISLTYSDNFFDDIQFNSHLYEWLRQQGYITPEMKEQNKQQKTLFNQDNNDEETYSS